MKKYWCSAKSCFILHSVGCLMDMLGRHVEIIWQDRYYFILAVIRHFRSRNKLITSDCEPHISTTEAFSLNCIILFSRPLGVSIRPRWPVQHKQNITESTFNIFVFWLYKTAGGISTLFILYNSYPFINNFSKQIHIID